MADWWQWSQKREKEALSFAVVGVGRFGTAVCRELISNGADVLAADYSEKAIDDLRQLEPSIEARVVDCTDEESMKESGILEMNTVVKKESFTFLELLFTCISAFATVGFDIGLTAKLNHFGQFILIVGMFVGRLGILLLLSALWQALYKSRIDRQKRIGYPRADLYV